MPNTQPNPLLKASDYEKLFFSYINPKLNELQKQQFEQNMHYDLHPRQNVLVQKPRFENIFDLKSSLWLLFWYAINYKLQIFIIITIFSLCNIFQTVSVYLMALNFPEHGAVSLPFILVIFGTVLTDFISTMVSNHLVYFILSELIILKNNLIVQIVQRALRLNIDASSASFGNIINLIQIDCQNFENYGYNVFLVFYVFFGTVSYLFIAVYVVGWTIWVFIAAQGVMMLLSNFIYYFMFLYEKRNMKEKDRRLELQSNVFGNIKFIKFNVMENFFIKLIYNQRKRELYQLACYLITISVGVYSYWMQGGCTFSIFLYFYYIVYKQRQNLFQTDFVIQIKVANELQDMFRQIPYCYQVLVKLLISVKRLNKYFAIKQINKDHIQ